MNKVGQIQISIHQFKTVYAYGGEKYSSFGKLREAISNKCSEFTEQDSGELYVSLLRLERATILRHYAAAVKPKTASELILELSDHGVEAKSIEFPCANIECNNTAIEDRDYFLSLADIANEAEAACDFTDGLCQACDMQKQQEDAMEEVSRAQHEAREDMCNA